MRSRRVSPLIVGEDLGEEHQGDLTWLTLSSLRISATVVRGVFGTERQMISTAVLKVVFGSSSQAKCFTAAASVKRRQWPTRLESRKATRSSIYAADLA